MNNQDLAFLFGQVVGELRAVLDDVKSYGLASPEGGRFEYESLDKAITTLEEAEKKQYQWNLKTRCNYCGGLIGTECLNQIECEKTPQQ